MRDSKMLRYLPPEDTKLAAAYANGEEPTDSQPACSATSN